MGIKDKQTYGEYYWAMQVEAQKFFNEGVEEDLAPHFRGLLKDIVSVEELNPAIKTFLMQFIEPTSQTMGLVGMRFASEVADSIVGGAFEAHVSIARRTLHKMTLGEILTPAQATLLYRRKKIPDNLLEPYMQYGGYNDVQAGFLNQAYEPYPTIPELVLYSRYHGDPENIHDTLIKKYEIEPLDFELWNWLGLRRIDTIQAQSLFKRGAYTESEFYRELARIGWHRDNQWAMQELAYVLPNPMLLVQGGLVQGIEDAAIIKNISMGDIHPTYAKTYLDAVLTKPSSQDVIAYRLRKEPSLATLPTELRKIGIHADYYDLYKELAYQIPPVADIITMAVREAFTPEIAKKFGQYEDYPKDLETWAGQKGLSAEWSKRYWAAHWNLPSPLQGFEMLHRGVIDESELNMLLRALDVMPFWRDKLTSIAYRRLTRVDIRRMYKQGVLDEKQVYESYLEHGYNPENAKRMSEFTIRQTLATLSKFTSGDIVKAFTNRMISKSEAISLLDMIGIRREDGNYILSTAEYKRQWAFTDQQIAGIRNLYKKRVYDENQTRDKLSRLNLPSDQINVLMEQWHYEKVEELDATWTTAQTLTFYKKGFITAARVRKELYLNGYDDEHINVYIKNVQ